MSDLRAPFPYFGGKSKAAPIIWRALGDPGGYVEPLYATTNQGSGHDVAHDVNLWCRTAPDDLRIVLCGYDNEHDHLLSLGWRSVTWKSGGGYGGKDSDRERLWLNPACLGGDEQLDLFADGGAA